VLSYKVFPSGLSGLAVQSMCKDVADSLTATGTVQGDAYHVTTAKAYFSTVAAGSGARLDTQASSGDDQAIYNGGANALKVYPPTGARINNAATNAAVTLAPNTGCLFNCVSITQWFGVLSA
jgi:hypothetical protein